MHERDVEGAVAQPGRDQRRVELVDREVQGRVFAGEGGERGGQQGPHRGRERADAQRPGQAGAGRGERGGGPLQGGEDLLGVRGEDRAGGGERDAPAGARQQRRAGLPFQGGELLRHRRRGVVVRGGDGDDGAAVGEVAQEAQLADVEHQVSLCSAEPT